MAATSEEPLRTATAPSGFTLVELLVVLAIAGLLVALVPPVVSALVPDFRAKAVAQEVVAELRDARGDAIARHRPITLVFSTEGYGRAGAVHRHDLPRSVSFLAVSVPPAEREADGSHIDFYPDGSTSGARVRIAAGKARIDIVVDWLTGRISING